MTRIGQILEQGRIIRNRLNAKGNTPFAKQKRQLWKLLHTARHTAFGKHYHFGEILQNLRGEANDSRAFYELYRKHVPIFDYDTIYAQWWHRDHQLGESDVCWKGRVRHYALSSGTSGSASKYIPVTRDMVRAIHRVGMWQFMALLNFDAIPPKMFTKRILMLGGSTNLRKFGTYYEGDLSGITAGKIPFYLRYYYKPGKKIAANADWDSKIEEIAANAPKWDIAYIAGNPAWLQIMMERIIAKYGVKHIHEIWPSLMAFAYGGVSFEPYRKSFSQLLGKPITYLETYLASEGFVAFQRFPNRHMEMILNNGIFYEFIPFTEDNFDADGQLKPNAQTLMIDEVEEGKNYALLMSTCAGAWRYMIGDTIQFTDKSRNEIIITGRTKHFISLCGEHLSVDNMNKALEMVADEFNMPIREFTVAGVRHDSLFSHQWYIGVDRMPDASVEAIRNRLDEHLKALNDDYAVERTAALKEVFLELLPADTFYKWMEAKGKMGGQHKFPRVLKADAHEEWRKFIGKQD